VAKIEKLKIENKSQSYKKNLITKLFREDETQLPKFKKVERANLLAKMKLKLPKTEEESK